MAKGKNCPMCGHYMVSVSEKYQPLGCDIVYECRACRFRERVFEFK